jgi:peptide chain release factor 2
MRIQIEELNQEMSAPGFWDNLERAQQVNQRLKGLEDQVGRFKALTQQAEDIEVLIEMGQEEEDPSMADEVTQELETLRNQVNEMRLTTLLTGPYDHNSAILSLHAGAGGTEAQDWCQMLYRMYTRYCEKRGYQVRVLDLLEGDEAGIKSVTFEVNGENAYGYLKAEKGVHRLVRISPFDSASRRHTSFVSLDVMPQIDDAEEIEIRPEDLKVDTYRSSGAGGQHINKTDSAVRMTHVPTGIVVSCQTERSQVQNRETCLRMLRARLVELKEREQAEKIAEIKGELKKIEWGSQIRSYVFHPYSMVKDHRTGVEVGSTAGVMDGDLDLFINTYLQMANG